MKPVFFKLIPVIAILVLVLGLPGSIPVRAAQTSPEPPAGLSAADWAQINALLAATLPAQQAYLKASNTETWDEFGYQVAVDEDTVVVGADHEDSSATGVNGDQNDNSAQNSGAAYVFVRSGTTWSQQAYLKASNTGDDDRFGYSVAVSGDTVVVGAYYEDSAAMGVNGDQADNSASASGAAYVFVRSGTTWTQQAYLKASNTNEVDVFGWSVAISGDMLVVGAFQEDSNATGVDGDHNDNSASGSGAAYVFTRSGTTWSQQAYLKASNTGAGDWFGYSVAIDGDTAVVGAYQEAYQSGAAYVFTRSGTTWSQQAYLKASNTGAGDFFGGSVAVSGDTVAVGAKREDSNAAGVNGNQNDDSAEESGAAYVFTRSGTTWSQQAYLKASNTGTYDYFGNSVAISGDTVVVGAMHEASSATGVNGVQNNNSAIQSGAAYVFTRSGTTWSQQAYLKASNTGAWDEFGSSVAVDGDTVVVGADHEDSSATGLNGNQNDNSAAGSGAAYVFEQKYFTSSGFRSAGTADGYILESGENTNVGGTLNSTSTTFNLGDGLADRQYRAILSFNTASLPDNAVITKVILKIRKQYVVGVDPFLILGRLKVAIHKGYFGTRPGLELGDFQAAPDVAAVGTFRSTPVNNWYSAVIGSLGYPYINLTGATQFRLYFVKDDNDDNRPEYMLFFSGNHATASARPTLIIEYYVPVP